MSETPIFPILPLNPEMESRNLHLNTSSLFGFRIVTGKQNFHPGIDLYEAGLLGKQRVTTKIVSCLSGIVVFSGVSGSGGNTVAIDSTSIGDNNVYRFFYQHLRDPSSLQVGQKVKQGDEIGYMGYSGLNSVSEAHLHLGIVLNPISTRIIDPNTNVIDPIRFFNLNNYNENDWRSSPAFRNSYKRFLLGGSDYHKRYFKTALEGLAKVIEKKIEFIPVKHKTIFRGLMNACNALAAKIDNLTDIDSYKNTLEQISHKLNFFAENIFNKIDKIKKSISDVSAKVAALTEANKVILTGMTGYTG